MILFYKITIDRQKAKGKNDPITWRIVNQWQWPQIMFYCHWDEFKMKQKNFLHRVNIGDISCNEK